MFKILGADGKEYGPVADAQLRQWIREGRAGGTTQVRADGGAGWVALNTLPEFADVFAAPPPGAAIAGAVPPVVTTLAWGMFGMTGISALLLIVNVVSILNIPASANFHPGAMVYIHWAVAIISLPVRVIIGIGLLGLRPWARGLAVLLAIIWALYGGWGMLRMVQGWLEHPGIFPGAFRSPMYLISILWSIVAFLFNIATAVLLSSKGVRAAFSQKSPGAA